MADFWIVRKRLIKSKSSLVSEFSDTNDLTVDDLYRGNSESIYWYWKGFNWRAFLTFVLAIFPAMPGYVSTYTSSPPDLSNMTDSFAVSCSDLDRAPNGWMKTSRLGFLTGLPLYLTLAFLLTKLAGFFLAILIYWIFNVVWASPGLGIGTKSHDEDTLVLPTAYRQDVPTQGRFSVPLEGETVEVSSMEKRAIDVVDREEVSEQSLEKREIGRAM